MAGEGEAAGARAQWRWGEVTARSVQCKVGFRKRRLVPGVEFAAGGVRTEFLRREVADLFNKRTVSIESDDDAGVTVFLCLTGQLARSSAAEELLAGHPDGSLALLTTEPEFAPVVVLPPDVAAGFDRWFQALP